MYTCFSCTWPTLPLQAVYFFSQTLQDKQQYNYLWNIHDAVSMWRKHTTKRQDKWWMMKWKGFYRWPFWINEGIGLAHAWMEWWKPERIPVRQCHGQKVTWVSPGCKSGAFPYTNCLGAVMAKSHVLSWYLLRLTEKNH